MIIIATPSASNQIQTQRVLYCYCSELVTQCYQVMAQTGEPSVKELGVFFSLLEGMVLHQRVAHSI